MPCPNKIEKKSQWAAASHSSIHEFGANFRPQSDGRSAQAVFLLINLGLIFMSGIGATLRSHWACEFGCTKATKSGQNLIIFCFASVAGGERCAEALFSLMDGVQPSTETGICTSVPKWSFG